MLLNTEQQKALSLVESGHNVVVMGQAGTGKSYLVKCMMDMFQQKKMSAALTCTTGIACAVYSTVLEPMTIHRWSGIGDGRYESAEIVRAVSSNVKFRPVLERILNTDVLIIDECSMLSMKLLETLSVVCSVKNKELLFGGIQIILVGDFYQLPPVCNTRFNDNGLYCFQSSLFDIAFKHRIQLHTVVRQCEQSLISAIHEISRGMPSSHTLSFIKSLSRPLQGDCVKLFSTNDLVDDYNRDRLLDFPGQIHEYLSSDIGERKHLSDVQAPRNLWLKEGVPVLLLRNLSDRLVNGLLGTVHKLTCDEITVKFESIQDHVIIHKVLFEVFDPRSNAVIATREQFPLKPAFGLTIHKSQGMTLDRVEIDCRDIFKPGQLGVAMGRVRTVMGLCVVNFQPQVCKPQPPEVGIFMNSLPHLEDMKSDFSCCRRNKSLETGNSTDIFSVEDIADIENLTTQEQQLVLQDGEEEFDEELDQIIAGIDSREHEAVQLPEDLKILHILEGLKCLNVVTPMQYEVNEILTKINNSAYERFCKREYSFLLHLLNQLKPRTSKGLGEFYAQVHSHFNSMEFTMSSLKLFETEPKFTDSHKHICFNICVEIRKFLLVEKSKEVTSSHQHLAQRTMTSSSRARIRYIGGYCIAKMRKKMLTKKNSHRFSNKECDKKAYEEAKCALDILNHLRQEEQLLLASTEEIDSLKDILRKQNLTRGLTNISDSLFGFFLQLTEVCLALLVSDNLNKMCNQMFELCLKEIVSSKPLYECFFNVVTKSNEKNRGGEFYSVVSHAVQTLLSEMTMYVSEVENIYNGIVKLYLLVMFSQFRKDTLDNMKINKTMAHRKQVRVSTGKTQQGKRTSDQSKQSKAVSSKKSVSKSRGPETEKDQDSCCSSALLEPQPSTSTVQSQGEGPSVSLPLCTKEDLCKVCNTDALDTDWIQCETCENWLHRSCAGLKNARKWKSLCKKGAKFCCKDCS